MNPKNIISDLNKFADSLELANLIEWADSKGYQYSKFSTMAYVSKGGEVIARDATLYKALLKAKKNDID